MLPGTGGLTRVVDKRKVRRDHADFFCTTEEGVKGKRAVQWRLVDEIVPNSKLEASVAERAKEFAASSKRQGSGKGIALTPLERIIDGDQHRAIGLVTVEIDRDARVATITIKAPEAAPPADVDAHAWRRAPRSGRCQLARELDDAILHLRLNELEIGTLVLQEPGRSAPMCSAYDALPRSQQGALAGARDRALLEAHPEAHRRHLAHAGGAGRARLLLRRHAGRARVRRRPLLHADRHAPGRQPPAAVDRTVGDEFRPLSDEQRPDAAAVALPRPSRPTSNARKPTIGKALDAEQAEELGLVTFALDDIDWEDEVRLFLEERASFSPDGLTGMEANLRFAGPETMETENLLRA